MYYKEGWEKSRERFEAFWACDMVDRCCMAVTSPRKKPLEYDMNRLVSPRDLEQRWTDPVNRYWSTLFAFSYGAFHGDAFPQFWTNLGPGMLAPCLGSDYVLKEDTVWFGVEPVLRDWDSLPDIKFNRNHELWRAAIDLTTYFSERAPGNFLMGLTDLGGNFDIAVSLRGAQQLIFDLMDTPDTVMKLIGVIQDAWCKCYEELNGIISSACGGSSAWMPVWSDKRWYPLQCDFAALLSPRLFDEYVKPALEREAKFLDRAIFHLDGPDAVKHIDSILEIDSIQGIQWQPTMSEQPESSHAHEKWIPLYKKIQAKGKSLVLIYVKPEDAVTILKSISSKGLFMTINCANEADAADLIDLAKKISRP